VPGEAATAELTGQGHFSCNFGFQQRFEKYTDLPGVDSAFKRELESPGSCAGATCTEDEYNVIEASTSPSCSTSDPCYVTAGSNNIPLVQVEVDKINPSEALVPSYQGSGTGIGYEDGNSFQLENIAPNTNNPSYDQIFSNFPTGGLDGDFGTRNPLAVCQVDYGCPTGN